jgi:hypothetical protein
MVAIAGASRLPFAMQLHAALLRCQEQRSCSAEMRANTMQLLLSVLPWQPLKLPQQRAWTTACCVTMLQQHYPGEGRGEEAYQSLARKSGI